MTDKREELASVVRRIGGLESALVAALLRIEQLAAAMSLYDKDLNTVSHHFLAADAEGNWLVIDCPDGTPRFTRGRNQPEARTHHFLDGGPRSAETGTSFARYQKLSDGLLGSRPPQTDIEAMALLRRVRDSTVWWVVYDPLGRSGRVSVDNRIPLARRR